MAVWPFRRKERKTLTAASVDLVQTGAAPWRARRSEDPWQREAWRQYDICGELRFAVQWISNAVSQADLYAAEYDPSTGITGDPTDNEAVQAVVASIFGGPERRPQAQSTLCTNWQIAGEAFILIRPRGAGLPDEWLIFSSTEISEVGGGGFTYLDPVDGRKVNVQPRDKLIRLWNPHPSRQVYADSAVRAAMPTLREIELTSMNIAARQVSRIALNGVWFLPEELDFAQNDTDPPGPTGLMELLAKAGEAAMRDVGQPSSQMPIIVPVPSDMLDLIGEPVRIDSDIPEEMIQLRQDAIRRLATSLDMPAEIVMGMGDSNHWNAWQIEEATYKIHVAPFLDRLGSALTEHFLHPMLRLMGVANPERYVLAFDTTEIISRPNRTDELQSLWDKRLISDDFMRAEAGVPDSAAPDDDERARRLLESLVVVSPDLLQDSNVQDVLGIELEEAPDPEPAPVPPQLDPAQMDPANVRNLPVRPDQSEEVDSSLVAAAELAIFDALSRAGARMLTREHRGRFQSTPKHELYMVIPTVVNGFDTDRLLADSFAFIEPVAAAHGIDAGELRQELSEYASELIVKKRQFSRDTLRFSLNGRFRGNRG